MTSFDHLDKKDMDPKDHFVLPRVGDVVYDDLGHKDDEVVGITHDEDGNVAYWLRDPEISDGGRFPWEIGPRRGA